MAVQRFRVCSRVACTCQISRITETDQSAQDLKALFRICVTYNVEQESCKADKVEAKQEYQISFFWSLFQPCRTRSQDPDMERNKALVWAILFLELSIGTHCTKIRLLNTCPFTIWPAWTPDKGIPQISFGGAKLNPWQSLDLWPPPGWGGQFWARTECAFNATTGKGHCETGDCNGAFGCTTSGLPPITLTEFVLNGDHNLDFYDVSLLDGFNVPITVSPTNYRCGVAGCHGDINVRCPPELQLRSTITGLVAGCDSACLAFARDEFCCTGAFSSPYTCRPSSFSLMFKEVCPKALTYTWDREATSFSCPADNDYVIEFCPYNAAHGNLLFHAQA